MSPSPPVASAGDQASLFAAAAAAGPGGAVAVAAGAPADATALRLRMAIAGLVGVRADAGGLVGDVPSHAVGAASLLSAAPGAGADAIGGELVDEDELLARDGVEEGGAGCGPDAGGARKPCKDCSCGLAEVANGAAAAGAVAGGADMKPGGKGCGSCALGDAFRCAGCPYLGLPPFKEGEKVELPSALMTSDI